MHQVTYEKVIGNLGNSHTAAFDNSEDAQLFWDTLFYLKKDYILRSKRPVILIQG